MSAGASFLDQVIAIFTPGANDRSYSDEQWPVAQRTANGVVSHLEAEPPASLLDLACGCGASTTALALKGFTVTAIDCTPASIEVAKRMSRQKGADVNWLCQDMRLIQYTQEFDFVCLRDVIFGIFETHQENLDLLRRIALALKPGGRCLIEAYNKEFSLRHGVEDHCFHDPATGRFVSRGKPYGPKSGIQLYSHDEWRQMLSQHGLSITRMHGWKWPKDPAPPPWRADLIVAEKTCSVS